MKPTRKVITRSPHRSVGAIHEPWFQSTPIQHESHLEKQCIETLLLMPGIVQIESQPFAVEFTVEGRQRIYTPDLRVTLADGSQALVEPKGKPFVQAFRDLLDAGLREAVRSLSLPLYLVPSGLISKERANRASEIRSMARRTPPTGAMDALLSWMEDQRRPTVSLHAFALHLSLFNARKSAEDDRHFPEKFSSRSRYSTFAAKVPLLACHFVDADRPLEYSDLNEESSELDGFRHLSCRPLWRFASLLHICRIVFRRL
jgi:hypothetical protein